MESGPALRPSDPGSRLVDTPADGRLDHVDAGDDEACERLLGRVLGGRYRLLRRLGQGGMGVIFEAQRDDGELVALKTLRPSVALDVPRAARRFVREASASMALRNEHAVRVLDVGTDDAAPFLVMELLRGSSLDQVLRRLGPLPPPLACRLFADACEGVAAAHEAGIIHRDLKPANLFLHEQGGQLVVKVCDFGIAKCLPTSGESSGSLTRSGGIVGSPMYMAPEQAQADADLDARADVWGLCLSLHEALSGVRPWAGRSNLAELLVAICTQQLPPLRHLAPWVDPALARVVHRGLAREASQRWPDVRSLAAALAPLALPGPLSPAHLRPLSPEERAQRPEAEAASGSTTAEPQTLDSLAGRPPPREALMHEPPRPAPRSGWRRLALPLGLAAPLAALAAARWPAPAAPASPAAASAPASAAPPPAAPPPAASSAAPPALPSAASPPPPPSARPGAPQRPPATAAAPATRAPATTAAAAAPATTAPQTPRLKSSFD